MCIFTSPCFRKTKLLKKCSTLWLESPSLLSRGSFQYGQSQTNVGNKILLLKSTKIQKIFSETTTQPGFRKFFLPLLALRNNKHGGQQVFALCLSVNNCYHISKQLLSQQNKNIRIQLPSSNNLVFACRSLTRFTNCACSSAIFTKIQPKLGHLGLTIPYFEIK